jgi:hypothetical protein
MGEAVVYEDTAGKREYLGLVLKPTERRREDQSVVITLKLCPVVVALWMTMLLTKALV